MLGMFVTTAKWTLAACGVLALPLFAVSLIFAGYAAADAIRTFGPPAVAALLALFLAVDLLWKRYGKADEFM